MPNKRKASDSNQSSYKKVIVPSLEEMSNIVSRCASSALTSYLQKHPISCAALPLAIVFNQRLKAVQSADEKNKARKTTVDESNQDGFVFNLPGPVKNFTGRESELNKIHKSLIDASKALGRSYCVAAITQSMASLNLDKTNNIFSVNGLGGIGKTQLALKYAQLYAKDYDNNVIWVDGENPSDSFKRLAGDSRINIKTKNINGHDKADNDIAREVYDHFKDKKSLFIFDNVESCEAIKEFLPHQSLDNKPHILITSRYQNWGGIADKISLDVFSNEEARNFVKKELNIVTIEDINKLMSEMNVPKDFQLILKKDDIQKDIENLKGKTNTLDKWLEKLKESLLQGGEQHCTPEPEELVKALKNLLQSSKKDPSIIDDRMIRKLNRILQGLPLALQQAVAYIKQQRIVNPDFGVKDYLEEYSKATEGLLSFNLNRYNNDPYIKTVMTTWKVALDKIKKDEEVGNEASKILNIMAYLAPDNIPSKMLELIRNRGKLAGAIDLLRNYSMISQGNKSDLSNIRRLVQEVIRIGLRKQEAEEEVLKNVLKILKDKIKCIKPKSKSSMINHALLICVRASRYHQLHQAIENLFPDLNMKEEPTKSLLQCIIDQKRVRTMQYILENMEDQWKQENRQLLVQFLLKGFENNKTGVVNSFKGELQNLMSDPSIFKLLANANLNNVHDMSNINLSTRIMNRSSGLDNRSSGLDIRSMEEITITRQKMCCCCGKCDYYIIIDITIKKGTSILEFHDFLHNLKNEIFSYCHLHKEVHSSSKIRVSLLSSNIASRKPYLKRLPNPISEYHRSPEKKDDKPDTKSLFSIDSSDSKDSGLDWDSHEAQSSDSGQTIPPMDNYSYNSGIIPSFLQPNKIASQQASGSSYHGMHFTGNCFFRSIPEVLGLHSRQIPTFMGSGSCNFNLLCFQEKEVVSHMQTSVGSRHGMHFVDNYSSDPNSETLSSNSKQISISERHEPMEENSCSSDLESFEEFTSDEIKDASSSPSSVMEVNSVSCTCSNGPYSRIWRPF